MVSRIISALQKHNIWLSDDKSQNLNDHMCATIPMPQVYNLKPGKMDSHMIAQILQGNLSPNLEEKNKSVTVVASSMVESCPIQTCCCRLTFHRTRTWSLKIWHGKQHELVLIILTSTQLVFTPQYEQCQPEYSNYLLILLLLHTSWPWLLLGTLTSLLPGKPAGYDYVAWRLWQQGLRRHLEQREFGPTGPADLWANSGESDAQSK